MIRREIVRVVLVGLLVVSFALSTGVSAQSRSGRSGLYGDWQIKMPGRRNGREEILVFSRNQEGYTGQWINAIWAKELKDVKFEDNKLSFTQVMYQDRTSKFAGTIENGQLSGTLTSERGETEIKGKRAPRMPLAVGSWDMKIKAGEREYTGTLTITADKEGNLSGTWKSPRGEGKVSDVKYQDRKLTFTRVIERDGNRMELAFEGTVGYRSLEGTYKGSEWEAPATAIRVGAPIIGTWDLDLESERPSGKQRLRINPDMTALYGSYRVKKVNLDGDKVSFKHVIKFGDRELKMSFEGKVAKSKLTGELTTSKYTWKVTGARRKFRRPGSSQR